MWHFLRQLWSLWFQGPQVDRKYQQRLFSREVQVVHYGFKWRTSKIYVEIFLGFNWWWWSRSRSCCWWDPLAWFTALEHMSPRWYVFREWGYMRYRTQSAKQAKVVRLVRTYLLGDGFKYFFYVHPYLGKIPMLTSIFFKGVESTNWFSLC